jgi:hypothetical protein
LGALSTIPGPVTDSQTASGEHSGDGAVVGRGGTVSHSEHSGSGPFSVVDRSCRRQRAVYGAGAGLASGIGKFFD